MGSWFLVRRGAAQSVRGPNVPAFRVLRACAQVMYGGHGDDSMLVLDSWCDGGLHMACGVPRSLHSGFAERVLR